MKRKGKQNRFQKEKSSVPTIPVKVGWVIHRPILLFMLGFAFCMILFYWFSFSTFWDSHIQVHIVSSYAWIAAKILQWMRQDVIASGSNIISASFSVSVKRGCDAIEAMALYSSVLLAYPRPIKYKLWGLASGLLFLYLLNLIRIISLFLTGVYFHDAFEILHLEVWQIVFILFSLLMWRYWMLLTEPQTRNTSNV